jgi:hypothetical protein
MSANAKTAIHAVLVRIISPEILVLVNCGESAAERAAKEILFNLADRNQYRIIEEYLLIWLSPRVPNGKVSQPRLL